MSRTDHACIALHAATPVDGVALCAAVPLLAGDKVPELIHLLPKSPIPTRDGRGPYSYADAADLIKASMQETEGRLPIDENHATDLAAPNGGAAPARGWIVELLEKPDGIWGRVEWTSAGQQLLTDKAYRFISPVIAHHKTTNEVMALLRASLTNTPNMPGLAALNHKETTMNPILKAMLAALGLKDDADEKTALQAIETLKSAPTTALQSALAPIAKAAGLKDDAKPEAIAAQVVTLAAAGTSTDDKKVITGLQAELVTLGERVKTLTDNGARKAAEVFVDDAIKAGTVGVVPLRDHYITRHMADPKAVEAEFAKLPKLGPSGALQVQPATIDKDGKIALNADQKSAARALGIKEDDYAKTLAEEAKTAA